MNLLDPPDETEEWSQLDGGAPFLEDDFAEGSALQCEDGRDVKGLEKTGATRQLVKQMLDMASIATQVEKRAPSTDADDDAIVLSIDSDLMRSRAAVELPTNPQGWATQPHRLFGF